MKPKHMKLKHVAFAVGALFVVGSATAQTLTVVAGGASATRQTIRDAVVGAICGPSTAAPAAPTINIYENAANVRRITCNSTAVAGHTALDFSYDNTRGSYLGIGPVAGGLGADDTTYGGTPGGVLRVNIATCAAPTVTTIAGKRVNLFTGCGNEATLPQALVGNADVEPELFRGLNAPPGVPELTAAQLANIEAKGQMGVIYGIIASRALWTALRDDQIAAGRLPAACSTATPASPDLGAVPGGCAPSIGTSQVVSLFYTNAGPLNTDWSALFHGAPPAAASAPVRVARRNPGSGTQATFNATFMNNPCSASGLLPAGAGDSSPTYIVTESGSGGGVLSLVGGTSNTALSNDGNTRFVVGILSRETNPGTPAGTPNWGFLAVDGEYPIKANQQIGQYRWMAEQVLTLRRTAPAAVRSFFDLLATATGSPTVIAGLAGTQGIVALPGVADPTDPAYTAQRTRYRTMGNSCVTPFAVE